jgi:pyridinium-3,5-bisthiocarboxylic acid mononucleotide nickel chelatase
LLFDETTTIGVRIHEARRVCLEREIVTVETEYGPVRVKLAWREGQVVNVAPEFEDCQRLAKERAAPLKQVMLAAQATYRKR